MAVSTRKAGSSRSPGAGREQTMAAIASVVETQVVPRLLAAHQVPQRRDAAPARGAASSASLDGAFIAEFAAELIASDEAAVQARVARLRQGGQHQEAMSAESVCLEALAPAARHLGDLWAADLCSFIEVTTGAALLQRLMNMLRPAFTVRAVSGMRVRRAMLVAAPGEQHRFGLSMLAEFFRKDGWQVALPNAATIAQIVASAAGRPLELVGLSCGGDRHLGALAACIAALRASAANPGLIIMVGGPIFLARPELVRTVGADATAADAEQAVKRARELLSQRREATAGDGAAVSVLRPARKRIPAVAGGRTAMHAR